LAVNICAPEIELARKRIVNLASLYLIETSKGDLELAARLIRDNTFLSLSRGGSGLLKALFAMPEYALLGRETKGKVEDFLMPGRSKKSRRNTEMRLNTVSSTRGNSGWILVWRMAGADAILSAG
jgi:hypothetical protein